MKINRLTEIIILLLNKKIVTAKELADKFQVSTRTIYRDIEELSLSGIPVYMNKGKNGGIYLLEEYSLNKTILSEKDK
ncbi:helix-turn-helix transcriptional regulator [Paraclostridium sordellii]|uniref:DeoR family transcriptional regulator n=2 Tax=Paraclostridium sordellii TaxID=1505 RepID=A0A0C7R2D1_PARSO|nr:HTH domain-containing protein [Paeniclostridium sordellii]CEN78247.1 DeoR family transcriptional regulator [[Clostridium] sordellii] [Paeniclostridium sordellii]CEQ03338.1 DeoR family transcriptional regulator [[Clostridium] sordellii] [Paeniclostridium sordellii]